MTLEELSALNDRRDEIIRDAVDLMDAQAEAIGALKDLARQHGARESDIRFAVQEATRDRR